MNIIYDKIAVLQAKALEYEKVCLRIYWHVTYFWSHSKNVKQFREAFLNHKSDLFEIIETYSKIWNKAPSARIN